MNDFQSWMSRRIDELHEKLDAVSSRMNNIDVTLARNTADVEHHIARTDALEKWVEVVSADVSPIKEHVARLRGIGWFVGVIAAAVGVAAAAMKLWGG